MTVWMVLQEWFFLTGKSVLSAWLVVFIISGLLFGVFRSFFHARKIQSKKFSWPIFRHELFYSVVNMAITGVTLQYVSSMLVENGLLVINSSPATWGWIGLEFVLYFFAFDLYFYLVHRLVHVDPLYRWIHKVHHRSTSPNPLTTYSVSPLEGIAMGVFVPVFLSLFTVHEASMALIFSFAPIMGLYVHMGHEFFPRWWYQTCATKWFMTPMYHDQHHQYFTYNYGGFTTIWDHVFRTVRPDFLADFAALKARTDQKPEPVSAMGE